MKKFALILTMILCISSFSVFADELNSEIISQTPSVTTLKITFNPIKIKVDGNEITFKEGYGSPMEQNDRILVPLRQIMEDNKFEVAFVEETNTIFARNTENDAFFAGQLNNSTYSVNGESREFDTPLIEKDGRTMVPVRVIYEMLGYDVSYDDVSRTVIVTTK